MQVQLVTHFIRLPLVGLMLIGIAASITTSWAVELPGKESTREATFYRNATFGEKLTGEALESALALVTGSKAGRSVPVRVLGNPDACASKKFMRDRWARSVGRIVEIEIWPPFARGRYYLMAAIDFAALEIRDFKTGELGIAWYECAQNRSYTLHSDATRNHFLLMEGSSPLWGWTIEKPE